MYIYIHKYILYMCIYIYIYIYTSYYHHIIKYSYISSASNNHGTHLLNFPRHHQAPAGFLGRETSHGGQAHEGRDLLGCAEWDQVGRTSKVNQQEMTQTYIYIYTYIYILYCVCVYIYIHHNQLIEGIKKRDNQLLADHVVDLTYFSNKNRIGSQTQLGYTG